MTSAIPVQRPWSFRRFFLPQIHISAVQIYDIHILILSMQMKMVDIILSLGI